MDMTPLPPNYDIELSVPLQYDGDDFIWFHPRVAAIPGAGPDGGITVLMTLQKHLQVSDYYSELYFMRSDDLGKTWTEPATCPELAWCIEADGTTVAVCDVTPGWHPYTGKYVAIGTKIRYDASGAQLEDRPHSRETAYTVYDPKTDRWTAWDTVELPDCETTFFLNGAGCCQWEIDGDGTLLIPVYYSARGVPCYSATVLRCAFDGQKLTYLEHGDELHLDVPRGFCEPSIVQFRDRHYLTLRNDEKGYVSAGDDGLHFDPIRPWTFDDGSELGSYNTQQHWLAHRDALFLVYTRRGVNNDHVMRHRAPLLIAQVDPDKLHVIRDTERILIPESGAPMGNFGAAVIDENESWVTVAEFMWPEWNEMAREKGAAGRVFVARVRWSAPNQLARH